MEREHKTKLNNKFTKSPIVESNIKSIDHSLMTNSNKNEKERNLLQQLFTNDEQMNTMVNSQFNTIDKHQSIVNIG